MASSQTDVDNKVEPEAENKNEVIFFADHEHGVYKISDYRLIEKLGSGSYGRVYLVKNTRTQSLYAMKKFKMNELPHPTTLREVSILKYLQHPNIVPLHQFIVKSDVTYMVMEYLKCNLSQLLRSRELTVTEKKSFQFQLLQGILFCHNRRVIHRDIKPHNILVHENCKIVKICDFGLARQIPVGIKPLTPNVVTLCYRAPELLLGDQYYASAIDIWSLGCVFAEMTLRHAPFRGNVDLDIWLRLFLELGVPSNNDCPGSEERFEKWNICWQYDGAYDNMGGILISSEGGYIVELKAKLNDEDGMDLILKMLTYHQNKRITAQQALLHRYYKDLDKKIVPAINEENVGFPEMYWNDLEKPEFYMTFDDIVDIKMKRNVRK